MNGASEATLQELLAVNQQMAASIAKLAGTSGGSSGGGGGSAAGVPAKQMNALGKAAQTAGSALGTFSGILGKALTPALSAATAGFNAVVKSGQVLYQNQIALAEGAIQGTNSLASLTAGLEQLPGILGLAMKAYNYEIKKKEAEVAIYQQISTTGARFGASLDEVRRSAASSYLSLDEFATVMKEAGTQLRYMGGTSEEGAKNLVKFNSTMIKGEVGKGLLGMGYSLTEVNGLLANYSESVGGMKADQLKDQKKMEQSVKAFAEELDLAAQLEGKTREQKAQELKEASQNAAIQNKLSQMTTEQQEKYRQAMLIAQRTGGKGAQEYVQAMMLGLPPVTKAAQQFAATNNEAARTMDQLGATVMDGTKAADSKKKMDDLSAKAQMQSAEAYRRAGKTAEYLAFTGQGLGTAFQESAKVDTDNRNKNIKSEEDARKRIEETRKQQKTAQDSTIGELVQMQGAAKHTGTFLDLLSEALKPLAPYILKLNDLFIKLVTAAAPIAAELIEKGLAVLSDIFSKVDWEKIKTSFMAAWDSLTNTFGTIYESVTKAMGSGSGLGEFLQNTMIKFFDVVKGVIEAVGVVINVFVQSTLFQTLKEYFLKIVDIVTNIVDVIVEIVKSPFGTWLANAIFSTIDLFMTPFKLLIDAISAAVDIVFGIVKIFQGDFKGGMDKIMDGVGTLVKTVIDFILRIPKFLVEIFGGSWTGIRDAINGFIDGLVDAVKNFVGGIISWFRGGKEKAGPAVSAPSPASPGSPSAQPAPSAANMPPMTAEAQKRAAELGAAPVKTEAGKAASTPAAVAPKSQNPEDILIAELQTLNKITTEMLRSLKDTADYTRSTANLIASNGNMFRRA